MRVLIQRAIFSHATQDSAPGRCNESEKKPRPAPALNHSHWGTFEPVMLDGRVTEARPFARDPDPSPLLIRFPTRSIMPAASRNQQCAQDSSNTAPAVPAIVVAPIATSP